MLFGTLLHSCCNHGAACCPAPRDTALVEKTYYYPLKAEFDKIKEPELILFHGTSRNNADTILREGFRPELCYDPSFGKGLYMTTCINFACGMAMHPEGVVLVCRVKPGIMLGFEEYVPDYEKENQDSNVNFTTNEYVIYDRNRILPIMVVKDANSYLLDTTDQEESLLTYLPNDLTMIISRITTSLDAVLLPRQTQQEVEWLFNQLEGVSGINVISGYRQTGCVARHCQGKDLTYYRIINEKGKQLGVQDNGLQMEQGLRLTTGMITGTYQGTTGTQSILDVSSQFLLLKKRTTSLDIDISILRRQTQNYFDRILSDLAYNPAYRDMYLQTCCRHLGLHKHSLDSTQEMINTLQRHIRDMN